MWFYRDKNDNLETFDESMIEDNVGFVYIIYNQTKCKFYIGKKLFTKSKTYQKNKKKKKTRISSDWQSYTGSSEQLNNDIASGHTIVKTILHLCPSKGWMSYLETKEILMRDCLLSDDFYNEWFSCKVRRSHLKGVKHVVD